MSDKPIYKLLEELPQSGVTVTVLNALDFIVPGSWQNITNFEQLIKVTTGEDDQAVIQAIGEKAMELYNDPSNGYQRAVWVYQMVDSVDKVAGAAALANKLAGKWSFGLLERFTPKADNAQAVDAALKFAAELATFCLINGIPGDSVGDFASSLVDNSKEDIMRIAAWLAIDCVIPFGPDAMRVMLDGVQKLQSGELMNNSLFKNLQRFLPGGSVDEQKKLVQTNLEASSGFLSNFIASRGLDQKDLLGRVRQYVDIADDKLDYVGAVLDMATNYYEHTGIQTTARRLIVRAYGSLLAPSPALPGCLHDATTLSAAARPAARLLQAQADRRGGLGAGVWHVHGGEADRDAVVQDGRQAERQAAAVEAGRGQGEGDQRAPGHGDPDRRRRVGRLPHGEAAIHTLVQQEAQRPQLGELEPRRGLLRRCAAFQRQIHA
jgi:hypothetical protein